MDVQDCVFVFAGTRDPSKFIEQRRDGFCSEDANI